MTKKYLVFTSDGVLHETDDYGEAVDVIDSYGPEVVDHNLGGPGGPMDTTLVPCSPIRGVSPVRMLDD